MNLSIIVPTFNSELTISKCLDSILLNNYSYEIIIVNDGSDDNTLNIIKKYKMRYPNIIRIINQKNRGVSSARNNGIANSNGKYLLFIDSDDYIEDNMIKDLLENINNNELIITSIYYNKKIVKTNYNGIININNNLDILYNLTMNNLINSLHGKLYRRDIITNNNIYFDEELSIQEDLKFNYEYIKHTSNILFIDKPYYHYITFNNSLTTKYLNERFDNYDKVLKTIINYYSDNNYNKMDNIYYFYVKNTWSSIINVFNRKNNYSIKKNNIKYILNKVDYNIISKSKRRGVKYKLLKYILLTKKINIISICGYIIFKLKKIFKIEYK